MGSCGGRREGRPGQCVCSRQKSETVVSLIVVVSYVFAVDVIDVFNAKHTQISHTPHTVDPPPAPKNSHTHDRLDAHPHNGR